MIGREEVLAPILDPLHGPVELASQRRDQQVFGIELAANAEAATRIGHLHDHGFLGKAEHGCEHAAVEEWHLGDAEYRDALLGGVPARREPTRLHRNGGVPLHRETLAAHIRRGLERVIRIATRDLDSRGVGAGVFVDQKRAIGGRLPVQDRRQALNLGRDQGGGVFGDVGIGRDYDCDWLPDIADFVARDRQLQEILKVRHRGDPRPDRLQNIAEIHIGEHADHTGYRSGRGRINAADTRVWP